MSTPIWIQDIVGSLKALSTAVECCAALRMSRRTLARHMASGRIKTLRSDESGSARVLVPRVEIERFLRGLA